MRTYVRVGGHVFDGSAVPRNFDGSSVGHHPARGPGFVLRVGRAARRSRVAWPPGDRRRRGRAGRQLRGQGLRRAHRDGRPPGPPTVSARDRGAAADVGLFTGQRRGVRGVPRHHTDRGTAVGGRGVPRRRRPVAGRRAPRSQIAARLRARGPRPRRAAHHRRHRADQIPGQGRQPGGQARRAAAGAAGPRTGVPAPAAGAPAVGRGRDDRREAARARHRRRSPMSPNSASPRWRRWSAGPWAASCMRCPATSTGAG